MKQMSSAIGEILFVIDKNTYCSFQNVDVDPFHIFPTVATSLRIAIMANGKLHCCGSSMFLKKHYGNIVLKIIIIYDFMLKLNFVGTGYNLIIAYDTHMSIEKAIEKTRELMN